MNGKGAADGSDAVAHVAQSGPARRPVGVKPAAGVADREMQSLGGIPGTHGNLGRSGVLGCIVDRREAGEVDRALDLGPAAAYPACRHRDRRRPRDGWRRLVPHPVLRRPASAGRHHARTRGPPRWPAGPPLRTRSTPRWRPCRRALGSSQQRARVVSGARSDVAELRRGGLARCADDRRQRQRARGAPTPTGVPATETPTKRGAVGRRAPPRAARSPSLRRSSGHRIGHRDRRADRRVPAQGLEHEHLD